VDGCADDGSDFGEDDEDWNVYRQISKDQQSDSSDEVRRRIHVIWGGGYISYEEEDTCLPADL
jgi:hypothetical protein